MNATPIDVHAAAQAIADDEMFVIMQCEGIPSKEPGLWGLVDDGGRPVTNLTQAGLRLQACVRWLLMRGLVDVEQGEGGERVRVKACPPRPQLDGLMSASLDDLRQVAASGAGDAHPEIPELLAAPIAATSFITREEWVQRYAQRIADVAKWDMPSALSAAEAGASAFEYDKLQAREPLEWVGGPKAHDETPECQADEEMSCWSNDGAETD